MENGCCWFKQWRKFAGDGLVQKLWLRYENLQSVSILKCFRFARTGTDMFHAWSVTSMREIVDMVWLEVRTFVAAVCISSDLYSCSCHEPWLSNGQTTAQLLFSCAFFTFNILEYRSQLAIILRRVYIWSTSFEFTFFQLGPTLHENIRAPRKKQTFYSLSFANEALRIISHLLHSKEKYL